MALSNPNSITRRSALLAVAASAIGEAHPALAATASKEEVATLTAAAAKVRLRPEPTPETEVWAFDGQVPGPVLRIRHGEEARVRLVNQTTNPLSLHWHGVRNTNAMDGVGGLTQVPIAPGGSFDYRFAPPDAGTFLIRPLVIGGSSEPAGRGLSGLLIVEEREAAKVDQEVSLLIQDWRIGDDGALAPFGSPLDAAGIGRLGNGLTVNGKAAPLEVELASGARVRLRLANLCNARTLRLRFDDLRPYVLAIDGQPTETFEPLRSTLPFAPGTRYDLVLDMPKEPGTSGKVAAAIGNGLPLVMLTTARGTTDEARPALPPIMALPRNRQLPPEIRLQNAVRKDAVIGGGGRPGPNGEPVYTGDPKKIWTINGASGSSGGSPLLTAKRGAPVVLMIRNQTPVVQPIHLHGHCFRLLHVADDGWEPYWLDTVQIPEGKSQPIAFLADNPGKWALSSTVLERFDTGLWTWFEVT
jgi:FtsP/CotA-like multicopper oxidase with cupredoxin domain